MNDKSCLFCINIICCDIRNDFAFVQDEHKKQLKGNKTFIIYNRIAECCKNYEWDRIEI